MICKLLGHRWVFTQNTLPRRAFCARCGKSAHRHGSVSDMVALLQREDGGQ